MDVYEALYTTRAMRRVRPDPIPSEVQQRILDAAIRAPSGGNAQNWHFVLVDDATVKAELGPPYRRCTEVVWSSVYKERVEHARAHPELPESIEFEKMHRSADHLARNFEHYPLLLFAFCQHDPTGGSIFPAVWSAMLAARAEGVGSSLTSAFMLQPDSVRQTLGVPDASWNFAACVAMGYPTGRWGVAPRRPVHEVTSRNSWDGDPGFEIPEPLWPQHPTD